VLPFPFRQLAARVGAGRVYCHAEAGPEERAVEAAVARGLDEQGAALQVGAEAGRLAAPRRCSTGRSTFFFILWGHRPSLGVMQRRGGRCWAPPLLARGLHTLALALSRPLSCRVPRPLCC
jgi:hypothetical protein